MKTQPTEYRTSERNQTVKRTYLYHFKYGSTHYYYCSYDSDIVVNDGPVSKMADPQTFLAAQISHTKPSEGLESNPASITISLGANDPELKKYLLSVSPRQIDVEIWRVSSASLPGPIDYDTDVRMVFKGMIDAVGFEDMTIIAVCITEFMREDRQIPVFYYQKMCNHLLYDQTPGSCLVDPSLFQVVLTIDAIDKQAGYIDFNSLVSINIGSPSRALTITHETFQGGLIDDGFGNEIGIMACEVLAGPVVRLWLLWMPPTLDSGDSVTLQLGCLRIRRYCHDVFQNLPNFGGTPFIPVSNPAIDGVFS